MGYVNRSETLQRFQDLIQENMGKTLSYMPKEFNEEQRYALELFKKRIFLEEVIEEAVAFNRKVIFNETKPSLKLTTTAEELIEVFKLRSQVYFEMGFHKTFPDLIEGLNFDVFDKTSAIVFYQKETEVTGTCRLIFDSPNELPLEHYYGLNEIRDEYKLIGEISRNTVKYRGQGLGLEFRYLMRGMCKLVLDNEMGLAVSVIKKENFKMFSKFGKVEILEELEEYGGLDDQFIVVSYNPVLVTKFLKKAFLS
ncbi:MAG: hypothetical protein OIF32_10455 [Campylobacterales bacterium]|nr:hypothetical protein [Campylobacterales bacterium]